MGKPTAQNNNFINHFSHPHRLQLSPASSSPPCYACKLAGGSGAIYSCRPCNFSLHESCSKMKQVIKHPSHPAHTLTLLVAPVYDDGYFNCDGCGVIGTGFSYQCSRCDFDIHALCAYKPLSIIHKAHPHHNLKLAFHSPYGANKGFSCDICGEIGKNQWLYRCIPCEFDAHVGCIITRSQPHLLQHQKSKDNNRPRSRPNPNRPNAYEPRRRNNNSGYNGQAIGEESMEGSGWGEVDEVEGVGDDGKVNVEGEDVDGNGLEIVPYGDDDNDAARSESEFGGSSDGRSQCTDFSDHTDLYPLSVGTNQRSGVGRKKNVSHGLRGGLQGTKNPIQSPQTRRVPNNEVGAVRFREPPMQFNAIGSGVNNNEAGGTDREAYDESFGDGYCYFEDGGDGYDQAYDETYEDLESYSDITGGSECMYDGNESYVTMDDNQYLPMAGGPGMNNQNQYGQTGRPRNMGWNGRGGNTNRNMNQYRRTRGGGPYRANGGPNGPNGLENTIMNTMVQGLCQGLAMNMLGNGMLDAGAGGDVNNGGGLFGCDSESHY